MRERGAATIKAARRPPPPTFEPIRSKLQWPALRSGLVERPRVVDRLLRAGTGRFVSVTAPAGYGKTTALGQWADRDPRAFAWVTLDERDNDPVVLLSYIAAALTLEATVEPAVLKALAGPSGSLWSSGLPRLGSALASRPAPIVLVFDDVHLLHDPECLDALAALALHVPPGSQVVFSGRNEPSVGIARMRADGDLVELDSAALALNDREAQALLAAAGAELTETEAAELNQHAEGWSAGLYLAALSLARGASVASFDGSDRFVTDYLRAQVLSHIDPDETEFLLHSAVIETMSGPLCDSALERSDSAQMLERLERGNLFVIALDNTRTAFRYHHFFQEMLVAELERREPGVVVALRCRASTWCADNDLAEEAIEYSSAAGDLATTAGLVAANAFRYVRVGRGATVERWLSRFDDRKLLAEHPAIGVLGAWMHALGGRPDGAERWALAVEASDHRGPMPDGGTLEAWAATVRALLASRGIEQMRIDAEIAVRDLPPASPFLPASMLLAGAAALFLGDDGAETMLREAAEAATAEDAVWAGLVARSELALIALERGELRTAKAELALAGAFIDGLPSTDYLATAVYHAAKARLAIAQGQGARAQLSRCRAAAEADPDARARVALSRCSSSSPRPISRSGILAGRRRCIAKPRTSSSGALDWAVSARGRSGSASASPPRRTSRPGGPRR